MNYYLISEERLRDLLLLERKEVALLANGISRWPYYQAAFNCEKPYLISQIHDFNGFVDDFRKKYKRNPLDDEELEEFVRTLDFTEIALYAIDEVIREKFEKVEK